MAATTSITVRLPLKVKRRLDKLARSTARSRSVLAANAISDYVHSQEWQLQRIREGIADAKAGRVIPHEKVDAWLKSWGTDHELPPPKCE
jgi:predicted transcriptional regulator